MDKIWYIDIDGIEEGPFSVRGVRFHPQVTLDTLAWREGMTDWVPIRDIDDLRVLFEEDQQEPSGDEQNELDDELSIMEDSIALEMQKDPNYFFYILVIAIMVLSYVIYELYWWR